MNRITALNVFRRVVELGTFKAAADDLHLSQAAVSKNINELEDHLGTALINRTTRRMSITESGLAYYRQICSVLDALESADQSVMASSFSPKGRLRVSAPMSYGLIKINPIICEFRHRYPDISAEVILSDTYVDLIDKGIDVAIRGGGALNDSSMRSRLVCTVRRILCASPAYLSQAAPAVHPEQLKEHDCLVYSLSSSPRKWFFTRDNENISVELMPASYSVNNGIALKQAAVQGLGIILIPEEFVRPELASGELVEVMPEWVPDTHSLYAVYPYHKEQSQKVRLFIDFVTSAFREQA
ncbi:LysR family transcriptional regulator (plasmid) [Enterobacter mori]|uniref:LysR family transcriptional regulator n=1 Tax=Enterobacteriaceae TaxID=543 RepID=UPI0025791EEB|nr:LysR family transcriptional regulator [Citrobacter sp. Cpo221]MDM2754088.1 LysR family transcriptional regulator [Citrobacter sp. Cpo221]